MFPIKEDLMTTAYTQPAAEDRLTSHRAAQASMALEGRTLPDGYTRTETTERALHELRKARGWA